MLENLYNKYNLQNVINASGKMTILGVSKVPNSSVEAQKFGDQHFFVMKDLIKNTSQHIAELLGAPAALVVNSASAGIAQAVAGVIGRGSQYHAYHSFSKKITKREIIIPKGHNVDYGTPEEVMITLGGGQVIEAGYANMCSPEHIEMQITENTAAILYVKSHHAVQKSMLSIKEALKVAHDNSLPLILDAAAEEDLLKYVKLGVDIVIFSGAKAISGPAAGLIFGNKEYINWINLQSQGIGRAMKIGKENILGFTNALEEYLKSGSENGQHMLQRLKPFVGELNKVPFITAQVIQDSAGRDIYRADVTINNNSPYTAQEVITQLKKGDVAVYTREYRSNEGIIEFDIRAVTKEDMDIIVTKLNQIFSKKEGN
ncbi:SelA-like pyridoxal phosphate-dependent enzyme [Bombilactobacillus bombi]|uniref:SelA-like pyridoxal phosphate-dependent enzyme n=1 Tax=Bombilactobacillus bombi TaxID=1303590 RepID=A0A417Z4J7_9LACO|nr:DgaE family pyridoxal phosphate-dependent ammonia lyase [Bombilactobacillus bombi]RHW45634.1 SelA-like pyridoxal phosphate-dependent enzyme [Bombilactobacillus bombi]